MRAQGLGRLHVHSLATHTHTQAADLAMKLIPKGSTVVPTDYKAPLSTKEFDMLAEKMVSIFETEVQCLRDDMPRTSLFSCKLGMQSAGSSHSATKVEAKCGEGVAVPAGHHILESLHVANHGGSGSKFS